MNGLKSANRHASSKPLQAQANQSLCAKVSKASITRAVQKIIQGQTTRLSNSSQTALLLARTAQSFANQQVSVATHDQAWAQKNGGSVAKRLGEAGVAIARASKDASEPLVAITEGWAQKIKIRVGKSAADALLEEEAAKSTDVACPNQKLALRPVQDLLDQMQECWRSFPLAVDKISVDGTDFSMLALIQLAQAPSGRDEAENEQEAADKEAMQAEMYVVATKAPASREPAVVTTPTIDIEQAAEAESEKEAADKEEAAEKQKALEDEMYIPPGFTNSSNHTMEAGGDLVVNEPNPVTTLATTTTTTPRLDSGIRRELELLYSHNFVHGEFAKDLEVALRRNPDISIPASFNHAVELVRNATSVSLVMGNVLDALSVDVDLALRKSRQFATKAAGAELNARQLFMVFRRQFTTSNEDPEADTRALAESYNSKSKERDRYLHEHEMESYLLMRIRKKAQVSAANFARMSAEVRRGLASYTDAILARALMRRECASTITAKVKALRTNATRNFKRCKIKLFTREAVAAKTALVNVCVSFGNQMLSVLKILEDTVVELDELRARKPDVPLAKDFSLVRTWNDARIVPIVRWVENYSRVLKEHWLFVDNLNGTGAAQRDMLEKIFLRIDRRLHATTSPLAPQKVAACCDGDASEFVEVSSKIAVHGTQQGHLRGRTAHAQQAVLSATPVKVPAGLAAVAAKSNEMGTAMSVARMLDEFVNTGLAPQLQTLTDRMPEVVAAKGKVFPVAAANHQSFERVLNAIKTSPEVHMDMVMREAEHIRNRFDKKINQAEINQFRSTCRMLNMNDGVTKTLMNFSTKIGASAEVMLTQTKAIKKLAKTWADLPLSHGVHQKMVNIAERRSLRILNASGIQASISDTRVRSIQKQLGGLVSSQKLRSTQMKDWLDVIALAEADADELNGGVRLRKHIVKLLAARAEAVTQLSDGFTFIKNISETIVVDLEHRIDARKRKYVVRMTSKSELNAQAKLERSQLQQVLTPKKHAVEDLEVKLAKSKLDIAGVQKQLEDTKSDGTSSVQPLLNDEVLELLNLLQKRKQNAVDIASNLAAAKAAIVAQQNKIAAIHIQGEQDEAAAEKAYQDWKHRVDTSLAAVKRAIRGTMAKLDPHEGIVSIVHPPSPTALEKIVDGPLPLKYIDAYNTVQQDTNVVEQSTLKIRMANVLRNKLSLAKAYRDSEKVQLELVKIRDVLQSSTQSVRKDIAKIVPTVGQTLHTLGEHLQPLLRAQIAASYLEEINDLVSVDKDKSASIPGILKKAKADQAAVKKANMALVRARKVSNRLEVKLDTAQQRLQRIMANTTDKETKISDELRALHTEKNSVINELLTLNQTMEENTQKLEELSDSIKVKTKNFVVLKANAARIKEQYGVVHAKVKGKCEGARRLVSRLNSLTDSQKQLYGLTPERLQAHLEPCKKLVAAQENLANALEPATKVMDEAMAVLDKDLKLQLDLYNSLKEGTNRTAYLKLHLPGIAKLHAIKETALDEARANTRRYEQALLQAEVERSGLLPRNASASAKLKHAMEHFNVVQSVAQAAVTIAQAQVEAHQKRQREIQQVQQTYRKYKTNTSNTEVLAMASQADQTAEASVQLLHLIAILRNYQIDATDASMATIRKLTQSLANGFACTGCKSIDTEYVYERPPSETAVDETQGEAWAEKQALARLHNEFVSKAKQFNELTPREKMAWKSFSKAASKLAKILHLKIMRSPEP